MELNVMRNTGQSTVTRQRALSDVKLNDNKSMTEILSHNKLKGMA